MATQRRKKPYTRAIFAVGLGIVLFAIGQGAAQRVFLSSNNTTPCFGDIVDLICYYPDVMKSENGQPRYIVPTPSWRVNGEFLFPDEDVFDQGIINQTASRLRVRIDQAIFTGDPVSFTCFLALTGRGEDNTSITTDPQESAAPPVGGSPVLVDNIVVLHWDHTDKGPCFSNLTFSYNITWYPVVGRTGQIDAAKSAVASNSEDTMWYVITNLLPNSRYQVDIVGFTSTSPRVYSEPVTVGFATQANAFKTTTEQDCGGCCYGNVNICIVSLAALSLVVVVTIPVSVLVCVAQCMRTQRLKKQIKRLIPKKDVEAEMHANPSYLPVVPEVQKEGGEVERSGKPQYMNVMRFKIEGSPSHMPVVPVVQGEGKGLESSGQIKYMNVELVD